MTGFAGIVRFDAGAQWSGLAERLGPALEDRMPGKIRTVTRPNGLFVHRQSILLPEDVYEAQPHAAGGVVFCFNGRLDNRDTLARKLALRERLSRVSDGRLAFEAVRHWGEGAIERLRGDFALVAWWEAERRLLLASDIFSNRPLFFHRGKDFIAFATNLRPLRVLPEVPLEIDEERLADFLVERFPSPERTFFRNIERVGPARLVTATPHALRRQVYWRPDPRPRLRLANDQAYQEAALEQLDRAVRVRLRAADPVIADITGGLDSSAVATSAARQLAPELLHTVTAVPEPGAEFIERPECYADERSLVEEVARLHPNIVPHFVSSSHRPTVWADGPAFFDAVGEPTRGVMNVGWLASCLDQVRALGSRVLLTGQFGNFVWSWEGVASMRSLFLQGRWWHMAREIRALSAGRSGPRWQRFTPWQIFKAEVARPLLPASLRCTLLNRSLKGSPAWSGYSAIHPEFARETRVADRLEPLGGGPRGKAGTAQQQRLQPFPENGAPTYQVALLAGMHGVETRSPFMDREFIEFLLALPHDQFLRDGETRRLARRATVGRLPESVRLNGRIDMQCPEWFHRLQRERAAFEETLALLDASPLARRCLDLPRLRGLLEQWPGDIRAAEARAVQYKMMLVRGIHVGQFLCWLEGGNR